ncbi:hypothetical protein M3O96_13720 [Aquiflexum sp. TKW24L]|uniref:hypothetical protein n=1 Tax=Aquiflexum sp. TKW24L TaxID=2942212 RepID=UPI0020BD4DBE|nr:hypothetical protein [Aquiflexum sp. TKW24L]MCL6260154.1 hypothetical protein [Aquiflexum sp. TKW24L]
MKLILVFAILSGFFLSEVQAQQRTDFKEPSQMSKYDFLTLTSKSDSLTAVVNMFFRKRKSATTTGLIVGGSGLLIGLVVTSANTTDQAIGLIGGVLTGQVPEETKDPGGEIALIGLAGGAAITTIGRSKYTKNNLYKIISEYPETKKIPSKYASKLSPRDFSFMRN